MSRFARPFAKFRQTPLYLAQSACDSNCRLRSDKSFTRRSALLARSQCVAITFSSGRRSKLSPASRRALPVNQNFQRFRVSSCMRNLELLTASVTAFEDRSLQNFTVCILGDLHLQPGDAALFAGAQKQLSAVLAPNGHPQDGSRVVQLGDLGGYNNKPGSVECFATANDWLSTLPAPKLLVVGNHDLEGEEFESDEDNLAAWEEAFQQRHYWAVQLGPAVCIGLSSTKFRSNKDSVHEVHIDEEQLNWFQSTLAQLDPSTPVFLFTHAPPLGSGLKVLNNVHVKNRCAWLNHSGQPGQFMDIVRRHPNIRLWFSGHFHLSHQYRRSIGVVGSCAFVSCGVIGGYNRDGFRQSRVLRGGPQGFELFTLDHGSGELRLDLQGTWGPPVGPLEPILPPEVLDSAPQCYITETGAGYVPIWKLGEGSAEDDITSSWIPVSATSALLVQDDMLLEYDIGTKSPIGAVSLNMEGVSLVLLDGGGAPLKREDISDGYEVCSVGFASSSGEVLEVVPRNPEGGFYKIFQPNKWRLKLAQRQQQPQLRASGQPQAQARAQQQAVGAG